MAGLSLGLTRFVQTRITGGAIRASADATGTIYTTTSDTKLKVGSTAILYGNGTQIASATVDSTGKATWTLGSAPAVGTVITIEGVVVGSGGTVPTTGVTAPANLTLPSISGTAQVGSVLTRVNGTWSGTTPITYTHQWSANGVAISGATAATYTPVVGDVGKTITVSTTASNTAGSMTVTSAPTSAVIAAALTNGVLMEDGASFLLLESGDFFLQEAA